MRKVIAKQALELEVKSERLKNTYPKQENVNIVKHFNTTGNISDVLAWVSLPSSSYCYKPTGGKRGLKLVLIP